ncbi:MAG: N-acetylmuramoyl-L-alanine amidase [Microgenomates group bacterium]
MNRIIMHWTAGTHTPGADDLVHYHFVIDGAGRVRPGLHYPEANSRIDHPGDTSTYAAHTLHANTGAIGVAVAAMVGARERPFYAGTYPVTKEQVAALAAHVAGLCLRYGIPVLRETVLTHAEVQPTLGILQRGKWDITWLPGDTAPSDPVFVGDKLRHMISAEVARQKRATPVQKVVAVPKNELGWLALEWIKALFGGKK